MVLPGELLQSVTFTNEIDTEQVAWNEPLGFMQLNDADVALGSLRLIGFGQPLTSEGGVSTEDVAYPITRFADLAPEHQTIDAQGKGVGPRMHNTVEALAGMRQRPEGIGVYALDVDLDRLFDGRQAQGGRVARIARHASRVLRARLGSVESVVEGVHASYGDADFVQLEMPPLPEIRQKRHGVRNLTKPQFIIVRNPAIPLRRIGSAPATWLL